jgi:hypothetical protein
MAGPSDCSKLLSTNSEIWAADNVWVGCDDDADDTCGVFGDCLPEPGWAEDACVFAAACTRADRRFRRCHCPRCGQAAETTFSELAKPQSNDCVEGSR